MDDTHLFKRDKAFRNNGVEYRQECFNFFQAVDDLHNHGQVLGKAKDLCRMHDAVPAEAHNAAQNGRDGKSGFSGFQNNRFIQRNMPVLVGLAYKNSKQITKISPSRTRLKLWMANEENIVKPPKNPTSTADRTAGSIRYFSSVAWNRNPMARQPKQ